MTPLEQLPILLCQSDTVEAKREHVVVPVLIQELLVKVFVKFVKLLFVAIDSVQNTVLVHYPR